jgi:drug/metabolite transporter (DMT)-like permease
VRSYDAGRWLLLATLWSVQYLFLRVSVPVFGAAVTAEARALFAAFFLVPWVMVFARQPIAPFTRWKDHLAVGLVNNVLPFACMAWAAMTLPAGYLAVINGMVPLWTAVFAAWLLHEPLGARRAAGFLLGLAGVALLVKLGPVALDAGTVAAACAGVLGAAFWGWAGVIIKQRSGNLPPMGLAAGSIAWAALLMAPAWVDAPPLHAWTAEATAALVAVGALCSGLAYLPFFTLIRDIGPSRTLSVGLLVPVLGVLWGWLLLGETVTLPMLGGTALVLASLALVLRR